MRFIYKKRGFTLLELMLAIVFGALILSGIYEIYLHAKSFYLVSIENFRLQENIRFISNFLLRNISIAGYSGCNKLQNLNLTNATGQNFSLATSVQGFTSANPPVYLAGQVVSGTDVVVIQKSDLAETNVISSGVKIGASKIKVTANPATKEDRILLITDCYDADLFKADNYTGTDITVDKTTPISHAYGAGISKVYRFTEVAFFISATSRNDNYGNPIYALYEVINGGNKQELIENIKSMKIIYGVDTQNKGVVDAYFTASQITSAATWENVKSIIITLVSTCSKTAMDEWSIYIKLRER